MFLVAGLFPWEWLHPGGAGYWFYSGVFDAGILLGVLSGVGVYWRNHNCHVHRCWRLDWHPHPDHGHPVCYVHHPDGRAEFLLSIHHRVKDTSAASEADRATPTDKRGNTTRGRDPHEHSAGLGESKPVVERAPLPSKSRHT